MELLFLTGNRTTLYPQTKRRVELLDKDIFDRIEKWRMFSAIWELEIDDYFGKKISYKGITYSGSPESVFWCYFQPFFDHEMPRILSEVEDSCVKKGLEPEGFVQEAGDLLKVMVSRLWKEISKTDQLLKGQGFPKQDELKDIGGTIKLYQSKIDDELKAVLHRVDQKAPASDQSQEDMIDVKPNFMGVGLNVNAIFRWAKHKYKNM